MENELLHKYANIILRIDKDKAPLGAVLIYSYVPLCSYDLYEIDRDTKQEYFVLHNSGWNNDNFYLYAGMYKIYAEPVEEYKDKYLPTVYIFEIPSNYEYDRYTINFSLEENEEAKILVTGTILLDTDNSPIKNLPLRVDYGKDTLQEFNTDEYGMFSFKYLKDDFLSLQNKYYYDFDNQIDYGYMSMYVRTGQDTVNLGNIYLTNRFNQDLSRIKATIKVVDESTDLPLNNVHISVERGYNDNLNHNNGDDFGAWEETFLTSYIHGYTNDEGILKLDYDNNFYETYFTVGAMLFGYEIKFVNAVIKDDDREIKIYLSPKEE